jgi:hypothetical protein
MKPVCRFTLLVAAAIASFPSFAELVGVVITPDAYEVGEIKSKLATPAVDEVVRLRPSRVLMPVCLDTPPAKIIQFEKELSARHKAPLQLASSDKACPNKGSHA